MTGQAAGHALAARLSKAAAWRGVPLLGIRTDPAFRSRRGSRLGRYSCSAVERGLDDGGKTLATWNGSSRRCWI